MQRHVHDGGIRKRPRVPNACIRCRQQKIKCSGTTPCQQCSKRNVSCKFDSASHKILVDAEFVARLQRQAARNSRLIRDGSEARELTPPSSKEQSEPTAAASDRLDSEALSHGTTYPQVAVNRMVNPPPREPFQSTNYDLDPDAADQQGGCCGSRHASEDLLDTNAGFTNTLLPGNYPSFTVNTRGQPIWLGTSSNWSFGRRVLHMVHERVHGTSLPSAGLLFPGASHDLGWDGLRNGGRLDCTSVPDMDHATFLVNAVKFHCCRLFHLFDEPTFMERLGEFYAKEEEDRDPPVLWFAHYLLVMAFGKAFVARNGRGKRPPGADLFVRAMKLIPDISFMFTDPVQSVEVLICAALYLQCLDMRSAAYNMMGQAMRLAVEQGMHTSMLDNHGPEEYVNRIRDTWWTVFILDRRMSCSMGAPVSISDGDITATLPSFGGSSRKILALKLHVQLSKATAGVLRTVYVKNHGQDKPLLRNIKEALKDIADGSDELRNVFPLDLENASSGLDRYSAYLHILHHEKRLDSPASLKIASQGGVLSMLRICVSSAKQTMRILSSLQSQDLLAAFSAATVICLAAAVNEALMKDRDTWLQTAFDVLEEMIDRGSVVANYQLSELQQLDTNIKKLRGLASNDRSANQRHSQLKSGGEAAGPDMTEAGTDSSTQGGLSEMTDFDFSPEDGVFSGDQIQSVADNFDFGQLDYWLATNPFDNPFGGPYNTL